jgi:2-polyprenyl-3-methyl-5-hydroxy-6-metoxy-1,4-benzoquinol methylase
MRRYLGYKEIKKKVYTVKRIQMYKTQASRFTFIEEKLSEITPGSLLDVASGEMPFKQYCVNLGFSYKSHDFEAYTGAQNSPGLQNIGWVHEGHDFVCDILDIPLSNYDVVLLTEVLEHVPDPGEALKFIVKFLNVGGVILITVPFASRMHQAPYWFSAGLSPYWFEEHSRRNGLQIEELAILGNFYDVMTTECQQFFGCFGTKRFNLGRVTTVLLNKFRKLLEPRIPISLLESGGLGVFVVLKRI